MGSIKSRLERLEESKSRQLSRGPGSSPREWDRFFHTLENARRELYGLEPLPDLEYTEEDRQDDLRALEKTIPYYREGAGWKEEWLVEFLDIWEREVKDRLNKKGYKHE